MTPEKEVQDKILQYLSKLKKDGKPIFYERRQAGGFSYKKGLPDIYCVYNGQHIEIEVKKPNGSQSTMQEKFEEYFTRINIKYILAKSLIDVKSYFEKEIL